MGEFLWKKKGRMRGIIWRGGGVSGMVIPVVRGLIESDGTILEMFMFDGVVGGGGIMGGLYIVNR